MSAILLKMRPDDDFYVLWDTAYSRPDDWGGERYFHRKLSADISPRDIQTAQITGTSDPGGAMGWDRYDGHDLLIYNFIEDRTRVLRVLRWDLKALLTSCVFRAIHGGEPLCHEWDTNVAFALTQEELWAGRIS